jgi:hypothetical protein
MRIIPLTLRISHYTRGPAGWPGRPAIHVVGEWHTTATEPALTRVHGTVEMAASGDVRWTLVRHLFIFRAHLRFAAAADAQADFLSRGRRRRMGQRGRAARRARLGNGRHWDVVQCGARAI